MISVEIQNEADSKWNERLLGSRTGTIYQTKEYARYVELRLQLKPLFLRFYNTNGETIAQLLLFQSFRGRRRLAKYFGRGVIYSMAAKTASLLPKCANWNYGPVVYNSAFTSEVLEQLGNLLVSWKTTFDGSTHPLDCDFDFLQKFGFKRNNLGTFIIDLSHDLGKILDNTDKKSVRKNIDRAQERGVTITEIVSKEDFIVYRELLNRHRTDNKLLSYSLEDVFEGHNLLKDVGLTGFLAWHEKTPVGGILLSTFNNYVNEWGIARSRVDTEKKLYSLDLLRWSIIEYGKGKGCNYYDLTGVSLTNRTPKDEGLFRNKEKWGGRLVSYPQFSN